MASYHVFIRGIPHIPTVTEVNARASASTGAVVAEKLPVGVEVSQVLDIQPDIEGKGLNGKTYLWFKLVTPSGNQAWVRDDLLDLQGDCSALGYGTYPERTFAFALTRSANAPAIGAPVTEAPTTPAAPVAVADAPTRPVPTPTPVQPPAAAPLEPRQVGDIERIKRAAFAITAAFEGHGYAAYQNYDSGIVSYGRFQFTLNAGTLATVINRYLERSHSPTANELRIYQPRIVARDQSLRHDTRLRDLLLAAADENEMKVVQNEIATEGYWNRMLEISANPRGIQSPLGLALVFDIAINFGVMNRLLGMAEEELGVPPKSRLGANGVTEQQFIATLAERRRRGHYMQAERDNLPGLKVRGDFWVNLANQGDWALVGDAAGQVYVNGKPVQVRSPAEF